MIQIRSPYSGEVVGEVPLCGPAEVDAACQTAAAALARDDFPQAARAVVLDSAALVLTEHQAELAGIITGESGKAIKDARTEVLRAAETFRFAAAEARKLTGEMVPLEATANGAGKLGLAMRVPIGVVGAITPFNFPLNTVAHKVAPAIAAGCPVVLKPAPQTPLTSVRLVELLVEKCGLPADWITVVTDTGSEAGAALVEHPVPKMLTFTGSPAVGWSIAAKAPRKHVALELDSNAPVLVEPDVALGPVAERIVKAATGTAGQSCISVQRVLVHRHVHDELVELLAKAAEALVVGDPADERTDVGPLITDAATERVMSFIEEAREGGARIATGGELTGACVLPTVVDEPPAGSQIRLREIFGPVLAVIAYDDFDQAIEIANETPFGLQAGLFTNDLSKALRAVKALEFGGVLVNEIPTFRADQQPYGGVGDSGNTREGPATAVLAMTEIRFVSFQPAVIDPVPPSPGA